MNSLEIITPSYNPPTSWDENYRAVAEELKASLPEGTELLFCIVNDGSQTGFEPQRLEGLKQSLPELRLLKNEKNKGKGYSVRKGVRTSGANYIIYTDIDFPYQVQNLIDVYGQLQMGHDLVCGVRRPEYFKKIPFQRRLISTLLMAFNRCILRLPIWDTQCGLKGMGMRAKGIMLQTSVNHFLFEIEFLRKASKTRGLRMSAVTVELKKSAKLFRVGLKVLWREFLALLQIIFK